MKGEFEIINSFFAFMVSEEKNYIHLLLLTVVILIVVLRIWYDKRIYRNELGDTDNETRPLKSHKPGKVVDEECTVIINNVSREHITKVIKLFCNMFNYRNYMVLPRLYFVNESVVVTFPYGIDLELLGCFMVFLKYPNAATGTEDSEMEASAWYTIRRSDGKIGKKLVNQTVVLQNTTNKDELDRFYITTSENECYLIKMKSGAITKVMDKSLRFSEPEVSMFSLNNFEYLDFE
ncbi:MAG: hypothetical protein MI922_10960 [Bacteroidales bacterium]|nr:hypothetical protein [Bacteroidales bacterium]